MEETTIWDIGKDIFANGLVSFIIFSAVSLLVTYFLTLGLKAMLKKYRAAKSMPMIYLQKIVTFILYALAVFSILSQINAVKGLGVTLLGATSVMTVIVGLAAQVTFGNFISGFFISVCQPFRVGDTVSLPEKNLAGKVEELTFRHTVIRSIENTLFVIPNNVMDSAVLENRAFGQEFYKRKIDVTVGYDSDTELVRRLITETVLSVPEYADPRTDEEKERGVDPVLIRLENFGDSGLEFIFFMVSRNLADSFMGASKVRLKLLEEFRAHNITIPYTTLDVHMHSEAE